MGDGRERPYEVSKAAGLAAHEGRREQGANECLELHDAVVGGSREPRLQDDGE